jgi:hypothetical protein
MMANIWDKLRQLFRAKKEATAPFSLQNGSAAPTATVTADNVHRLARLLQLTDLHEYSCAETFDLLDEYVDLVNNKQEAALLMPIVKQHLDRCPNCSALFEDLLHALQSEV